MAFNKFPSYDERLHTKKPRHLPIHDETYGDLTRTFKAYIEKFFHGDKNNWNRKKEPYIYYKHLFRQFALQYIDYDARLADFEKDMVGRKPDHTTIYHSRDLDPNTFKLSQRDFTEIIKFLTRHFYKNVQAKAKTAILKARNKGYTKEDIARHCLVHPDIIQRLLDDKRVSTEITEIVLRHLNETY